MANLTIKLARLESSPDQGGGSCFFADFEVEGPDVNARVRIHIPAANLDEADVISVAHDTLHRIASALADKTIEWELSSDARADLSPPAQSTRSALDSGGG
ncbi:hypothetical protein [Rhodoblastus sp.]|uniref:hypothetical protein n=1 Tax=Rhodoblastus sp. TaxID=1962975 RepID=UPI003F947A95